MQLYTCILLYIVKNNCRCVDACIIYYVAVNLARLINREMYYYVLWKYNNNNDFQPQYESDECFPNGNIIIDTHKRTFFHWLEIMMYYCLWLTILRMLLSVWYIYIYINILISTCRKLMKYIPNVRFEYKIQFSTIFYDFSYFIYIISVIFLYTCYVWV